MWRSRMNLVLFVAIFAVVQPLSCVQLSVMPWTAACQASLSFTIFHSMLKLMSIESVMASNHLILCHHLLLLPSIFPRIRVFSKNLVLHMKWPKYWSFSFSFSINPSKEYSGPISLGFIGWYPCSPRDSQESSPIPHKGINSPALCLLYGQNLTSIHTCWKNHSSD